MQLFEYNYNSEICNWDLSVFLKATTFQKDGVTSIEEAESKIFINVFLIDQGEVLCFDHVRSSLLGNYISAEETDSFIEPFCSDPMITYKPSNYNWNSCIASCKGGHTAPLKRAAPI